MFELQEMYKARFQASQMLINYEEGRRFLLRYRLMLTTTSKVDEAPEIFPMSPVKLRAA